MGECAQFKYLDDLVPWEGQKGNICGVACHQITVQDSENTFVSDYKQVILFTFEFEDYGLETDS